MSFDGVWNSEFDPGFCQSDWSQALAPPPHFLHPFLLRSFTQGQRPKCLWDGVVMLVWRGLTPSEDLTGALFFLFLIPILSGHRGERTHSQHPWESLLWRAGSVTVGWMQGSQAQINAWVSQTPVIYSRLFLWSNETGALFGGGGGGSTVCAQPGLHYRSKSTGVGLQRLQIWLLSMCWGVSTYRGKRKGGGLASERKGTSDDFHRHLCFIWHN